MPRKRSRAVGSPQGQEQERGPGQPSAAPPQGRGFLCAGGADERCPESWVARSAANWGQLGRVVARPPPDEALAAAPRANGGKEKERLPGAPPAALHRPSQPEGRSERGAAPAGAKQLSPALLSSSPACQLLLPSKLSPVLRAGLCRLLLPRCSPAPPASQALCSRGEILAAPPPTAAGAPPGKQRGLQLEGSRRGGWRSCKKLADSRPGARPERRPSPARSCRRRPRSPGSPGGLRSSAPPDGASGGTEPRARLSPACQLCPARRVFLPLWLSNYYLFIYLFIFPLPSSPFHSPFGLKKK
ncbi:uncharacterized protein [Anas platyrhynchos]|uniref:uncharacterized protein n=1 Tax=Anas platyrhynchos TaxID=8839 RepID=UPI003AF209F3